jgi:2,3-bisphosphoglycerate-independent phosphoglycerate mutase
MQSKTPTVLVILDGFGYRAQMQDNAPASAHMPTWRSFLATYPHVLLEASGPAVGLPVGFIGNSEVGHLTLGAGRRVMSILSRFNAAIDDESFFSNAMLLERFNALKASGKSLHIMGLLSDAGVHSHEKHMYAYLKLARMVGLKHVYVHAILDGRDVPARCAQVYLERLDQAMHREGIGVLASIHSRFYAMDRDTNWDRTKRSYEMLVQGNFDGVHKTWQSYVVSQYARGLSDEFIEPYLFEQSGRVQSGDGVVFINFRADRAWQLAAAFLEPECKYFSRSPLELSFFISTTRYRSDFKRFKNDVLFEHEEVKNTLLDVLAARGQSVFAIAETEKVAHVTYFFRGEREEKKASEQYVIIPSIKKRNYVDHPEMSGPEITTVLCNALRDELADFYLVNYANADMVGHSGNFEATKKACEHLDLYLARLYKEVVEKRGGALFITADHGNAEEMAGRFKNSHTTNQVPFVIAGKDFEGRVFKEGSYELADVAPTIVRYMNIDVPREMGGHGVTLK